VKIGSRRPDFDIAIVTEVRVSPGSEYLFSGWLLYEGGKEKNRDAFITVGHDPTGQTTDPIKTLSLVWSPNFLETEKTAPAKWFRFERVFRANSSSASLWVRCGNRKGSPFFIRIDDVELREVKRELN